METRTFKRGDTFAPVFTRRNPAGATMNITDTTIASKMRLGAAEVTLTVTKTIPASGVFVLSATPTQTQAWTAGLWRCDVQYTDAGDVRSTETFLISVEEDVTF